METEPEESDNGEKTWPKRSNVLDGYNRRTVQTHAPARQIIVPLILTDRFILDFIWRALMRMPASSHFSDASGLLASISPRYICGIYFFVFL